MSNEPGYYWARRKPSQQVKDWEPVFLFNSRDCLLVFGGIGLEENPDDWEFGPRIVRPEELK